MIVNTPSRLFMMEGDSGSGKTTDTKIIAQLLGYPVVYYYMWSGNGGDKPYGIPCAKCG